MFSSGSWISPCAFSRSMIRAGFSLAHSSKSKGTPLRCRGAPGTERMEVSQYEQARDYGPVEETGSCCACALHVLSGGPQNTLQGRRSGLPALQLRKLRHRMRQTHIFRISALSEVVCSFHWLQDPISHHIIPFEIPTLNQPPLGCP